MNTLVNVPKKLLANTSQLSNYFAVEVAEKLLAHYEERDILITELNFEEYHALMNSQSYDFLVPRSQLSNYFAVKIAEKLLAYPEEKDILMMELHLEEYHALMNSQRLKNVA